jgi:HEAT repeat protein
MREIHHLLELGHLKLDDHRAVVLTSVGATGAGEEPPRREDEQSPPHRERVGSAAEQVQRLVRLGKVGAVGNIPELVLALDDTDGNVRRVAASALGRIGDGRAAGPLLALLTRETKPQVRQYAVTALGRIGAPRARLLLSRIAGDLSERDYTRTAAEAALRRLGRQT